MVPISAVIITKDEERRLPECLATLGFCDEIVVVDAGSADGTRGVAERAGARVVVSEPWPGFVAQKNRALDEARHDWVLSLDADERVSTTLRDEIQMRAREGFDRHGYRIPRATRYMDRWIRATDWYPDLQLRLFDRRQGRWEGALVHESVRLAEPPGTLRGEIEHHPYADVAEHLETIDRYGTLWAQQAHVAGRRTDGAEMVLATAGTFLRNYLLRGGLRLGTPGLVVSGLNAFYVFSKLAKLLERQRRTSPDS